MKKYLLIFLIMIIWITGSYFSLWNSYIIPYPEKVFFTAVKLLKSGELFKHMFTSISRIFFGFSITVILAVPSAVIFGMFPKIYNYFKSILEFMRHTPPLALIPMIILWFGIGEFSKITIIILASFFPVFLNTLKGIESCDKKLIEVGQVFNFTKYEIFRKIILPSAVPDILNGIKLGIGYSWRAIIGGRNDSSFFGDRIPYFRRTADVKVRCCYCGNFFNRNIRLIYRLCVFKSYRKMYKEKRYFL